MTVGGEPIAPTRVARPVRELLPRSASIIEGFHDSIDVEDPGRLVLCVARDMAANHQRQWQAENISRTPDASAEDVVGSKRLIDGLNAHRVALVEQIDEWVGAEVGGWVGASLHTETFGCVVDRLAIAHVRANNLTDAGGDHDLARVALRQLVELAEAYDDLVRDVETGRRRLPAWRSLKSYGHTR